MGSAADCTRISAASLNINRLFICGVFSDPMNPRLVRTIDDVAKVSGLSGPHTPYAIPGRILVSMASGPDRTGPAGIAVYTNDADFIASYKTSDHTYERLIKHAFTRTITSRWVSKN